jgi:ribulose-phosphate 3-epimerase
LTKPLFWTKMRNKKERIVRPAVNIVPSILAENLTDFLPLIRQAESFTDYVQIDLMDGVFVSTKSIPPDVINAIGTPLSFEVHLMFRDPTSVIEGIDHPGLKKVIFHIESDGDHHEIMTRLRKRGIRTGIAINPGTEIERIDKLATGADTILFMTVTPGRYGSPFRPEVLEKVSEARKLFEQKVIAVDGGVSLDNLGLFANAGVDYACVGSRIFLGGNPADNYRAFLQRLSQLEETKI